MAILIEGKYSAEKVYSEIKEELAELKAKKVGASLTVVLVGHDPASEIYVKMKEKKAKELGIISSHVGLPIITTEKELLARISKLNKGHKVHAILVQFPLPSQINERKIRDAIAPNKDVDGLNSLNVGKLQNRDELLAPCTPKGIIRLLEDHKVQIEGKRAVVIGRSLLVGRPVANMLINRNATVTICHSRTNNLGEITKTADILISAVGKARLITADMVKDGAVVIDVGTSRVAGPEKGGAKLVGDVDFEQVSKKASMITPVPGGIGPMTIAMLMRNTVNCAKLQSKLFVG
jgi:methylenetetrahydrofolate dehydrogenase (NADP+) / methenyltetrahydrofolate cyclohydrolase